MNELWLSRRTQEVKSKLGWQMEAAEFYTDLSMGLPDDWFERMIKVWKLVEMNSGEVINHELNI